MAGGNQDLLLHQIDARDRLGDRVLHLQPGVCLEKVEVVRLIDEKLEGARVGIARRFRGAHGGLTDPVPDIGGDRRGRFFQHLLVPRCLEGAIPLAEVDHLAMLIRQDLDLDVTGLLEVLLEVDIRGAECRRRLLLRHAEGAEQVGIVVDDPDPFSPSARGGLDHQRVADPRGRFQRFGLVEQHSGCARDDRDIRRPGQLAGLRLVAQPLDHGGTGPDELDAHGFTRLGKVGVLGQEAIAGMNRLRAGDDRGADNVDDVRVTLAAGGRADTDRFVRVAHVERLLVGLAEHGDGGDPHLPAGADHAHRDLSAVGDQDLLEHKGSGARGQGSGVRGVCGLTPDPWPLTPQYDRCGGYGQLTRPVVGS